MQRPSSRCDGDWPASATALCNLQSPFDCFPPQLALRNAPHVWRNAEVVSAPRPWRPWPLLQAVQLLTSAWGTATLAPLELHAPCMALVGLPAGAAPAEQAATSADAKYIQVGVDARDGRGCGLVWLGLPACMSGRVLLCRSRLESGQYLTVPWHISQRPGDARRASPAVDAAALLLPRTRLVKAPCTSPPHSPFVLEHPSLASLQFWAPVAAGLAAFSAPH
jgi:hypothetical protein